MLYTGLHSFIPTESEHTLTPDSVEKLLKCWCKVAIYKNGKLCNLLQISQMRAKDALLAEVFKKYYWTNEFVHATLAGVPEEMRRVYKEGMCIVCTMCIVRACMAESYLIKCQRFIMGVDHFMHFKPVLSCCHIHLHLLFIYSFNSAGKTLNVYVSYIQ